MQFVLRNLRTVLAGHHAPWFASVVVIFDFRVCGLFVINNQAKFLNTYPLIKQL